MPFWLTTIVVVVTILSFLRYGIPFVIAYFTVLQKKLFCGRIEPQPAETVPEYIQDCFSDFIDALESKNFQLIGFYTVEATEGCKEWAVFLQDESQQIHAVLESSTLEQESISIKKTVSLTSILSDDLALITVNNPDLNLFPEFPLHLLQSLETTNIDDLIDRHLDKSKELSANNNEVLSLSPEEFTENFKLRTFRRIEYLQSLGKARWIVPGESYQYTWHTLLLIVIKILLKQQQTGFAPIGYTYKPTAPENEVEKYVEAYTKQDDKKSFVSRPAKNLLFLGSLAFFFVVYFSQLGLQGVLCFTGVILFHELGHILAMKMFGYKDAAILFIPYLGALATARKENASLSEKVWISLAGPLPGLLLAFVLTIAFNVGWLPYASWGNPTILFLVVLNLFNLLPMYPLDGGQVVNLLVFSSNPYLAVVYESIGILLLILIGIFFKSAILIGFAVLIGLAIPTSLRQAKLRKQLQSEIPQDLQLSEDRNLLIHALFERLQSPPFNTLSQDQKTQLVKNFLNRRKESSASWITRLLFIIFYLFCLVVGIVGGILSLGFLPRKTAITPNEINQTREFFEPARHPLSCKAVEKTSPTKNSASSDRQLTLVGTYNSASKAQEAAAKLKKLLGKTDSISIFGQSVFVSTFNTNTENSIISSMKSSGAIVDKEDRLSSSIVDIRVTAKALNMNTAVQVAQELREFFQLANLFPIRAPWENSVMVSHEQLLQQNKARYTYLQLMEVQQKVLTTSQDRFLIFRSMLALFTGNGQWSLDIARKNQTKIYEKTKLLIKELQMAQGSSLDTKVIQLYEQQQLLEFQQMQQYTDRALRNTDRVSLAQKAEKLHDSRRQIALLLAERMGKAPNSKLENPKEYYHGNVKQNGLLLSVETLLTFQSQKSLTGISSYLCQKGFTDIHYELNSSSLESED